MKPFTDYAPPRSAANYEAHRRAAAHPTAFEVAIVDLCRGVERYVAMHDASLDYVLGPNVGAILEGIRGLLNGNVGQLDAGTVSRFLDDLGFEAGWCSQHVQMFRDCDGSCDDAELWRAQREEVATPGD